MKRSRPILATAAAAILAAASPAGAQTPDLGAEGWSMFGISRQTGNFWRYDFADAALTHIGKVRNTDGVALTDIDASAYFTHFQQLHAFWTDPADGLTKMLKVDVETGVATVDVINLGTGKITGAVAHAVDNPAPADGMPQTRTWSIYVLQDKPGDGDAVSGGININPNNSNQNEFTCTTPNGQITRDHLHNNSPINASGVYYEGAASYVKVKPKGNGNQNTLIINGAVFPLANANTYEITNAVNMQVRIQNDKPKNGKAMGHWWIDITADAADITTNGGEAVHAEPAPVSDLVKLDTQTREVVSVKKLARKYDALATTDGSTFYATSGQGLYRINTAAGTESQISSSGSDKKYGLEFAGSHLLYFELVNQKLAPVDANTGQVLGFPASIGMYNLGSMVFVPTEHLPSLDYSRYD